ncbi:sensor histidine kinase [Parapedobacter sp. DT-150]|uniref:sensor histidine kinase n=1 Tax=Parapedobacter sp. DT-150 TaxID=3396162 RepID=UPI003F1CF1B9
MRFYVLPFLLVIQGSAGYAFQLPKSPSSADSAIIDDWYRSAFHSLKDSLPRSDDLINKAWKMAISISYRRGIADGYYYTGCVYEQKGEQQTAVRYFEKAVSLYTQGQFLNNLPDCNRRLGQLYMQQRSYYGALQRFLEGLQVAENQENQESQIELRIQLANYHNTVSSDYQEAILLLDGAEALVRTHGYIAALGRIYLQYSISHTKQRNYERALHYSQLAKQAFEPDTGRENLLRALLAEGEVYEETRDAARLATVLERSETLLDSVASDALTFRHQLLYATELYFLGDYSSALDVCERLYTQLKDKARTETWSGLRALQARIHYARGNLQKADSLFNDYAYTKDSLYAAQYIGQGAAMHENYQLEKFERQIREQELQLSNTNYQRYGLIGGIVVLLAVLGILYFHFREKDKLAHRVATKNAAISVQNEVLKQANKQNDLLLREIHHRVKNNLQIINSLLSLQSRKTTNEEAIAVMQDSMSRINSIALIHNKLYQQQNLHQLNIQEYIEQLGAHLLRIYNVSKKYIDLQVEANDVSLDIDTAISVGLILTELITNSLKHAFIGREEGEIQVLVRQEGDLDYELVFKDNGIGIPEAKQKQTSETLGFRLIHSLTRQLTGTVRYTFDVFSTYSIRFKGQA